MNNNSSLLTEFTTNENDRSYLENRLHKASKAGQIIASNELSETLKSINEEANQKLRNTNMMIFLSKLANIYNDISLFNVNETCQYLRKIGLTNEELKWIIPTNNFLMELNKLDKTGNYEINIVRILSILDLYYLGKIWITLINKYKIISTESKVPITSTQLKSSLTNEIANKKNRLTNKKTRKSNEYELLIEQLYEESFGIPQKIVGEKGITIFEEFIRITTTRNWDNLLIPIFNEYITVKIDRTFKITDKYRDIYPLFRLLMPHKCWPINKDALEATEKSIGRSFNNYMSVQMDVFINKK